jgi:hypothetical protein
MKPTKSVRIVLAGLALGGAIVVATTWAGASSKNTAPQKHGGADAVSVVPRSKPANRVGTVLVPQTPRLPARPVNGKPGAPVGTGRVVGACSPNQKLPLAGDGTTTPRQGTCSVTGPVHPVTLASGVPLGDGGRGSGR